MPLNKVFDKDNFGWLVHLLTENMLGEFAKLVIELLGENSDQEEFKELFIKNPGRKTLTFGKSLKLIF